MSEPTVKPATRGAGSWLRWTVAALFGLIYSFAIWVAVFALVLASQGNTGLTPAGVGVGLMPVIFPVLVYAGVVLGGRRLWVWKQALLFLAGFALVGVFWLDVVMLQVAAQSSLVGAG